MLSQQYEVRVYDEFVIRDNTAVLKCHIPSFVRDYVTTTAWFRDDGLVIHADGTQGKLKHDYFRIYFSLSFTKYYVMFYKTLCYDFVFIM